MTRDRSMTDLHVHPTAADLIAGEWYELPGQEIVSVNPAQPAERLWWGTPQSEHVDHAVAAARAAAPVWASWGFERRARVLRRFAEIANEHAEHVAGVISDETGKVLWDARGEAAALAAKVGITLDPEGVGLRRVSDYDVPLSESRVGRCTFRPHGVMAVIGPFNFPAHLPNGHIIPALAMGNTIVFKPSDKTPSVGQLLAAMLLRALQDEDAPPGVVNLVHGGAENAQKLTSHADIDGILFTGSWQVGRAILEANLDHPGRIIALEMGGNSAAVVLGDADLEQAAIEVARCAFITTGQRCTCTRRLIVQRPVADKVIGAVVKAASTMIVGDPRAEHPVFMGPIISEASRQAVLKAQEQFARGGGEVLLQATATDGGTGGFYITPGIIRVDRFTRHGSVAGGSAAGLDAGCDEEVFGPLLRISVVDDLDEALLQTNATRYGLAASIFTRDEEAITRFLNEARAGCVNVNTGTAGASSKLPFGGLGISGNHRPAGAFSPDYCAYPVAGMIERGTGAPVPDGMTFDASWLR